MKKIGLLSDTHGYLPERIFEHFKDCDEIWHAGDIGTTEVIDKLEAFKPCRMVYGNIDGTSIRKRTHESLVFTMEGLKVLMLHIGGYPGKYHPDARILIEKEMPGLFICGHSHILKVQYDTRYQLLHINPGAAGNHGWHKIITIVRFGIEKGKPVNMEVIEIGERGKMKLSNNSYF